MPNSGPQPPPLDASSQPAVFRYPGVRPFGRTVADRERFFGRHVEIQSLLEQVLGTNLVVVYGRSGVGKTSLLNAGLFPRLEERDLLPVPIRFNHADKSLRPLQVIAACIKDFCEQEEVDWQHGQAGSLWEFFKTNLFWKGDTLLTPVLVFDQFEELMSLQTASFRRELSVEIGQVLTSRLPEALRRKIQVGEQLPFGDRAPDLRVVIGIREDFVGALHELAPEIPSILLNRFRLAGLSEPEANRAVCNPANMASPRLQFLTRPFTYADEAHKEILAAAKGEDGSFEPFLLQLFCSHIELEVQARQRQTKAEIRVTPNFYGGDAGLRKLTSSFYLDALKRLPHATARRRARRLCEEGLLTGGGRRRSVDRDELLREYDLETDWLDTLENARLLRKEPRLGTHYYELSHDRVARAIREQRNWRIPPKLRQRLFVGLPLLLGMFLVVLQLQRGKIEQAESSANREQTAREEADRERAKAVMLAKRAEEVERVVERLRKKSESTDTNMAAKVMGTQRLGDNSEEFGRPQSLEDWGRATDRFYTDSPPQNSKEKARHIEALIGIGKAVYEQVPQTWSDPPENWESSRSKLQGILDSFTRGWQIATNLTPLQPAELANWNYAKECALYVGHALGAQGKWEESNIAYSNALMAAQEMAHREPTNLNHSLEVFKLSMEIGDVLFSRAEAAKSGGNPRALLLTNALVYYQETKRVADRTVSEQGYTAYSLQLMAIAMEKVGRAHEAFTNYTVALEHFKVSLEMARQLSEHAADDPDLLRILEIAHLTLGRVQIAQHEFALALTNYQASLEVAQRIMVMEPSESRLEDLITARQNFGYVLFQLKRNDEAYTNYWIALQHGEEAFYRSPTSDQEKSLTNSFSLLPGFLDTQKDADRLLALYTKEEAFLEHRLRRAEAEKRQANLLSALPSTRRSTFFDEGLCQELNVLYGKIGQLHESRSNYAQAFEVHRKSMRLCREMTERPPEVVSGDVDWQHELLGANYRAGATLGLMNPRSEALQTYGEMRSVAETLVAQQPTNVLWKRHLAFINRLIANVHVDQKSFDHALHYLTNAFNIAKEVLAGDLENATYHTEWSQSVSDLALAFQRQTNTDEEIRTWQQAGRWLETLQVSDGTPDEALLLNSTMVSVYRTVKTLCLEKKKIPEAREAVRKLVADYERAVKAKPKDPASFGNVAFAYLEAGEFEKARIAAEAGVGLNPKAVWIHGNLAHALMFLNRSSEALSLHRHYLNEQEIINGFSWKEATRDDFQHFRLLGLDELPRARERMVEIEKLLETAK